MQRLLIALIVLLAWAVPISAQDEMTCDDYTAKFERELGNLHIRLEAFAFAPSALDSDYRAWQEKRVVWQAVEPPECAVAIHDDVVAMYANLGDISAFGLYLKVVDPESNSGQRLTQEAIVRTGESIEAAAAGLSEVSGIDVDVQAALDSLVPISERIAEGD